eukprot:scaffold12975_cov34-Tisochrysis_lutea.AAC.3
MQAMHSFQAKTRRLQQEDEAPPKLAAVLARVLRLALEPKLSRVRGRQRELLVEKRSRRGSEACLES